jgi:hypothetical protein
MRTDCTRWSWPPRWNYKILMPRKSRPHGQSRLGRIPVNPNPPFHDTKTMEPTESTLKLINAELRRIALKSYLSNMIPKARAIYRLGRTYPQLSEPLSRILLRRVHFRVAREESSRRILASALLSVLLIGAVGTIVLPTLWFPLGIAVLHWATFLGGAVAAGFLVYHIPLFGRWFIFTIVMLLVASVITATMLWSKDSLYSFFSLPVSFFVGFAYPLFVFLFVFIPFFAIDSLLLQRTLLESFLTSELLDALLVLEDSTVWTVSQKQRLFSHLEAAAKTMERSIPAAVRAGDGSTDTWIRNESKERAAATRELKKWVFSPLNDTSNQLKTQIVTMVEAAATGKWYYLPKAPLKPINATQISVRAFRIVSTLIYALSPIALLTAWKHTPFAPPGAVVEKLTIVAFALSVVYLLLSVDSSVGERVRIASELLKSITGGDQKK